MKKNIPLLWQLEEVGRAVLFRPLYVEITGDLIAGLLLSQIVWWFKPGHGGGSKPHLSLHNGRFWLAKKRDAWREEIGISPKQFDRACDHLVSLKLVDRRVLMRGRAPVVHLTLNVEWMSKLLEPYSPKGKNMDIPQRSKSDIPQRSISLPYMKRFKNKKGEKLAMGSAKEVQAKMENDKKLVPETLPTEKVKASLLAIYWSKLVALEYGGFQPPATKKEVGQFSHWIRKVGVGNSYPVMKWSIRNWKDFADSVLDSTGQKIGSKPSIGALLTHAGVAVTIAVEQESKPVKKVQLVAKPGKVKFVFDDDTEA